MKKQIIMLILIASLLNGCMIKRIFKGGHKGQQGGGHKSTHIQR